VDAEVVADVLDRPARLEHEPGAALDQLRRVLPWTGRR
jgi:hypothetical protein